eukprot:gene11293-23632_t
MSARYVAAAKALQAVKLGKSLNQYCSKVKMGKMEYALCCETLKYGGIIEELMNECDVNAEIMDVDEYILEIMIFDLLFGRKKIDGGGVVKKKIMEYSIALNNSLTQKMKNKGVETPKELISESIQEIMNIPRYIRINELKLTIPDGIKLMKEIFPNICVDEHIPSILVLPNNVAGLGEHPLIQSGQFILQDKASCFPSQILFDEWDSGDLIDACAAPGNKTSHLAALLSTAQNTSSTSSSTLKHTRNKIIAYDRNPDRAKLLKRRLEEAGANGIVTVRNEDFLAIDTNARDMTNVRYILLDPSCSGSGVVRSLERVLQSFQISALKKALSFPFVRCVVYSTCSIHEQENEAVVAHVLRECPQWDVQTPSRMSTTSWPRRGLRCDGLTETQSNCLVRCLPSDGTNGFFVALFVNHNAMSPSPSLSLSLESTEEYDVDTVVKGSGSGKDSGKGYKNKRVEMEKLKLKLREMATTTIPVHTTETNDKTNTNPGPGSNKRKNMNNTNDVHGFNNSSSSGGGGGVKSAKSVVVTSSKIDNNNNNNNNSKTPVMWKPKSKRLRRK